MKNNTFAELGEVLREEKNFIIFTHISGDADGILILFHPMPHVSVFP